MKLIDLLVQELPKRGGWPANISYIAQDEESATWGFRYKPEKDSDDEWVDCSDSGYEIRIGYIGDADDCNTSVVTREQYESALAESQKTAWNGGGLPPSGVECEARLRCNHGEWFFFRCVGVDCGVAFGWAGKEAVTLGKGSYEFRPLRTEAERKRDAAIEAMQREADEGNNWIYSEYEIIYDAIAAGKIPGVKLDD